MNYGTDMNDKYWRKCLRWQDSAYSVAPQTKPYGLDFANYSDRDKCNPGGENSWCGMHHHSQFKCVRIIKDSDTVDPEYPHHIKAGDINERYTINKCNSLIETAEPATPGVKNPYDRKIICEKADDTGISPLVWLNINYETVTDENPYSYTNGCISECTDQEYLPKSMQCGGGASCRDNTDEGFGKNYCYKKLDTVDIYTNFTFSMGTPDDKGTYDVGGDYEFTWKDDDENYHDVTLTYFYEIAKTEITVDQFKETMDYNPGKFDCGNAVCPVENVSFYDAIAFSNKYSLIAALSECYELTGITCADGRDDETDYCSGQGGIQSATVGIKSGLAKIQDCEGFRLPTEAEWEYAAGSGYDQPNYEDRPYFLGDITAFDCDVDPVMDQIGWYCGNSDVDLQKKTHPVALKRATDWGLYDMNGNVSEWIWDSYSQTLEDGTDPVILSGSEKVVRGGSFQSKSQNCRTSSREGFPPSNRSETIGFRIVKTIID